MITDLRLLMTCWFRLADGIHHFTRFAKSRYRKITDSEAQKLKLNAKKDRPLTSIIDHRAMDGIHTMETEIQYQGDQRYRDQLRSASAQQHRGRERSRAPSTFYRPQRRWASNTAPGSNKAKLQPRLAHLFLSHRLHQPHQLDLVNTQDRQ